MLQGVNMPTPLMAATEPLQPARALLPTPLPQALETHAYSLPPNMVGQASIRRKRLGVTPSVAPPASASSMPVSTSSMRASTSASVSASFVTLPVPVVQMPAPTISVTSSISSLPTSRSTKYRKRRNEQLGILPVYQKHSPYTCSNCGLAGHRRPKCTLPPLKKKK